MLEVPGATKPIRDAQCITYVLQAHALTIPLAFLIATKHTRYKPDGQADSNPCTRLSHVLTIRPPNHPARQNSSAMAQRTPPPPTFSNVSIGACTKSATCLLITFFCSTVKALYAWVDIAMTGSPLPP
eukprot:GHUV01056346.1.p1 GENE.GHUV01056346.1~~GHUV01056346.1.p1  ORF type:complete len:128 (+),score=6.50 GHUV01056346.1:96-479(+)